MRIGLLDQLRRESGDRRQWRVAYLPPDNKPGNVAERPLWRDELSDLSITLVEDGVGAIRLRHSERLAVDVLPDRQLIVHADSDVPQETISHFLADQVIPRAMAGEGLHVLHAAAIRHGDRSVLLIGASGHGKSTLAASFHVASGALLGDDATVVSSRDGRPVASPVYRSLRLLPDSLDALLPRDVVTSPIADYTSKLHVVLDDGGSDSVSPLPVAALCLLGVPHSADRLQSRDLTIAEACMALVENAFALNPANTAQAHERLTQASQLAASVHSFVIDYPREYSCLPAVRAAILDRVG